MKLVGLGMMARFLPLLLLLCDAGLGSVAVAGAAGELSIGQFSCENLPPENPASGWDECSSSGLSHFHTSPTCRSTRAERGYAARCFSSPHPPPGSRDASSPARRRDRAASISARENPE